MARVCDGAGIEALWVRDEMSGGGPGTSDAWTMLALIARDVRSAVLGATLDVTRRPSSTLLGMARTAATMLGDRLELSLARAFPDEVGITLERCASVIRTQLATSGEAVKFSIEAATPADIPVAAAYADDIVVEVNDPATAAEMIRRVRTACDEQGRDPATIGIAMHLYVSIGRTTAEAEARAEADSEFALAAAASTRIVGTLEQCQAQILAFAHAGITDLRCIVPDAPDLPDVVAQLTATTIGTMETLVPGSPRSKPPDPPETWGGRSARSAPDRP
jgi:alkanesulfonate monooxygenase SsuD/methylene tetrahydromethanopterin reductase-like flavin-dependent oxidoreductase (luciferase family)